MARLVSRGGSSGQIDAIVGVITRVGSAPDNDLCLAGTDVASRHARVMTDSTGDHWVEAMSSALVYLNGEVVKRARLHHLDVVSLGAGISLVYLDGPGSEAPQPAPSDSRVFIEWIDGPEVGARTEVLLGESLIGRTASCAIVVDSPAVSRAHARLLHSREGLIVEDLGSANGTTVGGMPVTGPTRLKENDVVRVGGLRSFRVTMAERSPSAPPVEPVSRPTPVEIAVAEPTPVVDQEWRTRLVWSADELVVPDALSVTEFRGNGAGVVLRTAPAMEEAREPVVAAVPPATDRPRMPDDPPTNYGSPNKPFVLPRFEDEPPPGPAAIEDREATLFSNAPISFAGVTDETSLIGPPVQLVVTSLILRSTGGAQTFPIGRSLVGRSPEAALFINKRHISRQHAALVVTSSGVSVEDLGSGNGTEVNGVRVTGSCPLTDGDRLAFVGDEFAVEIVRSKGNQ